MTVDELKRPEEFWIKKAQRELHERVKKKEFNMFSPFTDEKEIIRVSGGADKTTVTNDSNFEASSSSSEEPSHFLSSHQTRNT